jgi:hypothetical protein
MKTFWREKVTNAEKLRKKIQKAESNQQTIIDFNNLLDFTNVFYYCEDTVEKRVVLRSMKEKSADNAALWVRNHACAGTTSTQEDTIKKMWIIQHSYE